MSDMRLAAITSYCASVTTTQGRRGVTCCTNRKSFTPLHSLHKLPEASACRPVPPPSLLQGAGPVVRNALPPPGGFKHTDGTNLLLQPKGIRAWRPYETFHRVQGA